VARIVRWGLAGLVTVAAFAATTWICGALILPIMTPDPDIRWSIAGGAGLAVAALAALWGQGFATAPQENADRDGHAEIEDKTRESPRVDNKIVGTIQGGQVIQGGDFSGPITLGDTGLGNGDEPRHGGHAESH
jgi:hypothetical protein